MSRFAKSPARLGVSAVLATALILAFTSIAATSPASAAAAHARHAAAQATLDKVVAAFSPKRNARTAPRTTTLPRTDLTLLLRDLRMSRGSLSPSERTTADTYLARTAAGGSCTGNAIASAHFCVHYTPPNALLPGLNPNEATPAQAQLTSDTFEYVYKREVAGATNSLGFRAPLNDGDNLLDVTLSDLGNDGLYGYCDTIGSSSDGTYPAACAVDNDFSQAQFGPRTEPVNSLRVTAAHEFFHAIQFAYDAGDDSWFMEGTAVWMEDTVYPTINDYLQYLPLSQVRKPLQPADSASGLEVYGAVTFFKFLSERFKNVNIIRQVWTAAAVSSGTRNGIQAVGAVLAAKGYSFPAEFARYGVWNTLPPGSYGDRSLWPAPGAWATGTLSRAHHDTKALSVKINHLAHAPLVLRAGTGIPARASLRVVVDAPNTSHGSRATVQIRFRNGSVKKYAIALSSLGNASKLYGFNPKYVKSAIVVLTNASTGYNGQDFRVRAKLVY